MPTQFDDYVREVEAKAQTGGPETASRWHAVNATLQWRASFVSFEGSIA